MPWDSWTRQFWAWPLASLDMWRLALAPDLGAPPQWTTPARLALELAALRLWDFSPGDDAGAAVLVVSPFALHDARIADLAPGHSLMAALRDNGCRRLHLIEWKSATPATERHGVDDLLAALNVVVDDLGAPVDLVGLCQGGWLSLVYAARFPAKTRRLVAVGTPVDVEAAPSALSAPVAQTSEATLRHLIAAGGGCMRGAHMAHVWPREADEEARLADSLELAPPFDDPLTAPIAAAFQAWDRRTVDLPGPYFCEVVRHLYRENALARGAFPALGRMVDLRGLDKPLFLLVGETDAIAPPAQALAAGRLIGADIETARAPCGHLALFMGRRTLARQWPRVAAWLREEGS
ncbi:MAG: alpha/beta fold hydrolase [Methylocystis sp.]|uniref:alpha/beta fold hydrolase n=1 Tax=Methylocystis sp. TaxID=1911079 RepID=UPI003DA4F191